MKHTQNLFSLMRKKHLYLVSLSMLVLLSCTSQAPADQQMTHNVGIPTQKNGQPNKIDTSGFTQVKWKAERAFFGERKEGEEVVSTFYFENVGKKPFVIEEVRPSCGCTIVEYPKEAFQPGQSGRLTAKYDSKGRGKGFVKKMVIVKGNFKESPIALSFEGTIQ